MAEHNILGAKGEEAAARHLMFQGYSILERNWRSGHCEVDIIAAKLGLLVFVEVKTLSNDNVIEPEAHVNEKKRLNIIRASHAYLKTNDLDMEVRYDVISVTGTEPPFKIKHIENAFREAPSFVGRQAREQY